MKKILLLIISFFYVTVNGQVLNENFESTTFPPPGWAVFDNGIGTAISWARTTNPGLVYNGSQGTAYLNREGVATGTFAEDWLATTSFLVPVNGELRFWTRDIQNVPNGSVYTVRVADAATATQNNPSDYTTIMTYTEANDQSTNNDNQIYTNYRQKVIDLSAYAGQNIYIAFVMSNNLGDRWLIDDVFVDEQCLAPSSLTAVNINDTTADLTWSDPSGATEWEIEYFFTGFTPGTGTMITGINSNPYTLANLIASTTYDYYVRAVCDNGFYSDWSGPFTFVTDNGIINPPPPPPVNCVTLNGQDAGLNAINNNYSTFIGCEAGKDSEGENNLFLGSNAGKNSNGFDNIGLGEVQFFGSRNLSIDGGQIKGGNNTIIKGRLSEGSENVLMGKGSYFKNGNNNTIVTRWGHDAPFYYINPDFGNGNNNLWFFNSLDPKAYQFPEFDSNNKFIIDHFAENIFNKQNFFLFGDFEKRNLRFNVDIDPGASFVEINAAEPGYSGLKFMQLNNNSTAQPANGKVLSLNTEGEVILVEDGGSSNNGSTTNTLTNNGNNTLTSTVNGIASDANIITNFSQNIVGNNLETSINGVTQTTTLPAAATGVNIYNSNGALDSHRRVNADNELRRINFENINFGINIPHYGNFTHVNNALEVNGGAIIGSPSYTFTASSNPVAPEFGLVVEGKVRIGTYNKLKENKLQINTADGAGVLIGNDGWNNDGGPIAPTNGLLVIGNVGIGTHTSTSTGSSLNTKLVIDAWNNVTTQNLPPDSGLQLRRLTSGSTASSNTNSKFLTVDNNGKVILQTLPSSSSGGSTTITAGNNVTVTGTATTGYTINATDTDNQTLSYNATTNSIAISNGNSITLPAAATGTPTHDVYTIGSHNTLAAIQVTTTASSILLANGDDIGNAINTAISNGFKKIYIQEGTYTLNSSININNLATDLVIEGAGNGTKLNVNASIAFNCGSTTTSIYVERTKIKNFQINLTAANQVAFRIGGGFQRSIIDNVYVYSNNSSYLKANAIKVDVGTLEADYNTFSNIYTSKILFPIKFEYSGGVFNHNQFINFHISEFTEAIDLTAINTILNTSTNFNNNLFSAFELQAIKTGTNKSTFIAKEIKGANNTFQNFVIADYSPDNSGSLPPAGGYAFWVGKNAERTVIENCITEGNANTERDKHAGWYYDDGKATQFINNADTDRKTDYIKNELQEVVYRGDTSNPDAFSSTYAATKFNIVNFGENNLVGATGPLTFNTGTTPTITDVQGRNNLRANIYLKGNIEIRPQNSISGITAQGEARIEPNQILMSTGTSGSVRWVNPNGTGTPINTIYTADNFIVRGNFNNFNRRRVRLDGDLRLEFTSRSNPGSPGTEDETLTIRRHKVYVGPTHTSVTLNTTTGAETFNTSIFDNSNLAAYNFIVNGRAWVRTEVNVQSSGLTWPDYVFSKNYDLKPLTEVEAYINKYGHLHNMPSAKEIEEKGLPLADITTRQQEKIEELTLYAIEQDKKVTAQEAELEKLQKELALQKQEMESLKSMVKQLIDNKN